MRKIKIIALLFLCSSAHAEMFKCVGKDGKPVYQSMKCPVDAKTKVIANADKTNPLEVIDALERKEKAEQAVKIYAAIDSHLVIPGMTKVDAVKSIGNPTTINHGQYGKNHDEQWVYRKTIKTGKYTSIDKTSYVYLTNGIVTSVQWSQ